MNYKTELQSNNADLQALIDKANALPDAGSGGSGGAVETCTVTVTTEIHSEIYKRHIIYTVCENGLISSKCIYPTTSSASYVLENVVCNTMISVPHRYDFAGYDLTGAEIVDTFNNISSGFVVALVPAGTTNATITVFDND